MTFWLLLAAMFGAFLVLFATLLILDFLIRGE